MAEEIGFENGRNSNFEGLVTLTLTLDPAIRHTVVHHSSTSTYIPNFIEIEKNFLWTDGRTFSPSNIIRSTFGSRPKNRTYLFASVISIGCNTFLLTKRYLRFYKCHGPYMFDKTGKVFIFNISCFYTTDFVLMLDLFPSSLHLLLFSNSYHSNRVNENSLLILHVYGSLWR